MTETGQQPDIYGQVHPEESAELISKKLIEFDAAVEALSAQEKENITKAVEKCPELLTEAFKLQFLRCEVFQEDLAAKRYSNYWDKRVALFGPEKAFQKLTQDEALKDDTAALSNEFFRLVGTKDPSGRNIILGDPSKQDHEAIPTDSMARAIWYVFHAALEDETTQQKGWIILAYPQKARVKQFNRDLMKIITSSIKGCIPGKRDSCVCVPNYQSALKRILTPAPLCYLCSSPAIWYTYLPSTYLFQHCFPNYQAIFW